MDPTNTPASLSEGRTRDPDDINDNDTSLSGGAENQTQDAIQAISDSAVRPVPIDFQMDDGNEKLLHNYPQSASYPSTIDGPTPPSFEKHSAASDPDVKSFQQAGGEAVRKMHKFTLYETSTRFYLVGQDMMDEQFRVLKIDRTSPPENLNIFEDDIVYDKREMKQLLNTIDDGNKGTGGMKVKTGAWGLLGFIRFTEAYYMLLVTKRAQVAMIGGHYLYQIEDTELIPLTTGSTSRFQRDRNPQEARYLSILNNLDLNRSFYFSYSYNITRTLQHNIIREREALSHGVIDSGRDLNDMFLWNHHLLEPAMDALKNTWDWCLPIVHGFIDQCGRFFPTPHKFLALIPRSSGCFWSPHIYHHNCP